MLLGIAFLAFVSLGLPDGVLGVAWPSIRGTFALPISQLGALLFAAMGGYLASSFSSGAVVARIGVGRLLLASSVVMVASLLGSALAPGWRVMLACGVLAGLGAGAIDAGINGYAAAHCSARTVNWLHACYGVGATLGISVGISVGFFSLADAVVQPLIAATFPIPKIALLPLLILWLGIGEASKVAVVALGVFFPMAINTYAGVRQADPLLVRAAVSFGAGRWSVIRKVVLPSALPMVFAGLKLGAGTALLLLVAAEQIAADSGIGFLITQSGNLMETTKLMVGLVVLSLLGLLSHWGLASLERAVVGWRHT